MRILVEILHPAHVHFFRNFLEELTARDDEVVITARDKDVALSLLEQYGLEHEVLSTQRSGTIGLGKELVRRVSALGKTIRRVRPDVLTGIMGPTIALAGRRHRIPSVVFYDTEFATRTNSWVYRLANAVITPDCYQGKVPGRHVTYPGYHELAYLHPNRFTPDESRIRAFGVEPGESYSLVRFVSWQASHDTGEIAVPDTTKRAIVARLAESGRVLVSSESVLPDDLAPYRLTGPTADIHHLLSFAEIVVGESATMASEAAVLGTPAVYIARTSRGYIDDLAERYELVSRLQPGDERGIRAAVDRTVSAAPAEWAERRSMMLADKIDVTDWMVRWFEREYR